MRLLQTVDDVDALRAALATDGQGLSGANIEVFRAVLQTRPEVIRPHVLVLERGGQVVALLLARLERSVMPATFGYATIFRPAVRCLSVATDSVAGADADQDLLARELLGGLRAGDADVVLLQHVPVGSVLGTAAQRHAPRFSQQRFLPQTPHWVLDLPDSAEELHAQLPKSVRDNLRRYSRKLVRDFGERLEIRCYTAPEDFDVVVRDVEAIAATTYQRGLGTGFDAEHDAPFVRFALDGGWFRAWVLYIDGVPRAFETGYVGNGTVVIATKGFDPRSRSSRSARRCSCTCSRISAGTRRSARSTSALATRSTRSGCRTAAGLTSTSRSTAARGAGSW